jgi:hypothetical protein
MTGVAERGGVVGGTGQGIGGIGGHRARRGGGEEGQVCGPDIPINLEKCGVPVRPLELEESAPGGNEGVGGNVGGPEEDIPALDMVGHRGVLTYERKKVCAVFLLYVYFDTDATLMAMIVSIHCTYFGRRIPYPDPNLYYSHPQQYETPFRRLRLHIQKTCL